MTNGSNHLKQKSLFSLKDQTVVWGFFALYRSYSDAEGKRFSYINMGESIENDCSALKSWQILFVVFRQRTEEDRPEQMSLVKKYIC